MFSVAKAARSNVGFLFTQIRTSTKKAAGSKTSMKDSAGRRLGPKKSDGQSVKVGEIIMRQRGTKFYPGENVGIGKDHTIFALEPGTVRYYLDPFHPKRRFIGVALKRDMKLPTPHFAPRIRRFGRAVLTDPEAAKKEEQSLPRKQYLAKKEILEDLQKRELKRAQLSKEFEEILQKKLQLSIPDMETTTAYLIRLRTCLKNGFKLNDAQYNAAYALELQLKLSAKREGWNSDKLNEKLELLHSTIKLLNDRTSFNNKLGLIKHISESTKMELKQELIDKLKNIELKSKADRDTIKKLFENAEDFLTLSEEVHLRRQFLKPVLPETSATVAEKPSKKTVVIRRFNYETRSVDVIPRTKEAFVSRL